MNDKMLSVRVPEDVHAALVVAAAASTLATGHRVTVSDLIRAQLKALTVEAK